MEQITNALPKLTHPSHILDFSILNKFVQPIKAHVENKEDEFSFNSAQDGSDSGSMSNFPADPKCSMRDHEEYDESMADGLDLEQMVDYESDISYSDIKREIYPYCQSDIKSDIRNSLTQYQLNLSYNQM